MSVYFSTDNQWIGSANKEIKKFGCKISLNMFKLQYTAYCLEAGSVLLVLPSSSSTGQVPNWHSSLFLMKDVARGCRTLHPRSTLWKRGDTNADAQCLFEQGLPCYLQSSVNLILLAFPHCSCCYDFADRQLMGSPRQQRIVQDP